MLEITVRQATVADAAELSDLIRHTIRTSNSNDYSQQAIEAVCSSFLPEQVVKRIESEHILLCVKGPALMGTAGLKAEYLRSTFVHPEHQGHGLGKLLITHIEQLAREQSVPALMVKASITARGFYEHLGFELIGFQEHQEGSTFLMKKVLD